MRESETKGKGIPDTSLRMPEIEGESGIPMERDLREVVGYSWPVVIAPDVARLIASTEGSCVLCDCPERQLRRVLWLAGIALRDVPPLERVAPFEIMLGRRGVHLGASFDASEGLAIHIDVVAETERGRRVDARGGRERSSRR